MSVVPVTSDRSEDTVELFSRRGPRGGIRNTPAYGCRWMYRRDCTLRHGEPEQRAMARLVREGRQPGLLAYDGGEPVGWVAVAPRADFPEILASPHRRRAVASALLDAAAAHAVGRGARSVEAYPHAADGSDYKGGLDMYLRAGFAEVRDANTRIIVRRG